MRRLKPTLRLILHCRSQSMQRRGCSQEHPRLKFNHKLSAGPSCQSYGEFQRSAGLLNRQDVSRDQGDSSFEEFATEWNARRSMRGTNTRLISGADVSASQISDLQEHSRKERHTTVHSMTVHSYGRSLICRASACRASACTTWACATSACSKNPTSGDSTSASSTSERSNRSCSRYELERSSLEDKLEHSSLGD